MMLIMSVNTCDHICPEPETERMKTENQPVVRRESCVEASQFDTEVKNRLSGTNYERRQMIYVPVGQRGSWEIHRTQISIIRCSNSFQLGVFESLFPDSGRRKKPPASRVKSCCSFPVLLTRFKNPPAKSVKTLKKERWTQTIP